MPLNLCLLLSWLDAIDKAHPWLLGLVGSGLIAYVVYRAEKTNNEKAAKRQAEAIQADKTRDLENSARRFIMDNLDDADFIPLCVFAANAAPKMKHKRAIYNRFNYMAHDVQQEILRQQGISLQLPSDDLWIDECLKKLQADVRKYNLSDNNHGWLYDNYKYFKDGLRLYANESTGRGLDTFLTGMPIVQSERAAILSGGDFPRDICAYIDEWVRKELGEDSMLEKSAKPPLDWLNAKSYDGDRFDPKLFCLYMMQAVRAIANCMYLLLPDDKRKEDLIESLAGDLDNGQRLFYYEDVYFRALSWLYITYYDNKGAQ